MNEGILSYEGFVRLVLEAIDAAGIEYMIGGAAAAWAWGEPRSALDLDLVVNIPLESVHVLSDELKKKRNAGSCRNHPRKYSGKSDRSSYQRYPYAQWLQS